jgi:hypothetical protein
MLPFDDLDSGIFCSFGEIGARAAHEVVQHDDFAHRFGQQLIDYVRADKTGAANYHYSGILKLGHQGSKDSNLKINSR